MHPLLINEAPLQVLPSLAKAVGLNEALILQQIHYWINPKHNQNYFDGQYWVYNTYEQWQTQFPFWCQRTIRSAMGKLQESGLIITFVKQNDFRKIKHYTIDYAVLYQLQGMPHIHQPNTVVVSEEEKEKEETEEDIQEMLMVWNDTVQSQFQPYQSACLTPKRLAHLECLRETFSRQGISWRKYCDKISQTRFLMGENTSGFKVTLDWALNLDNACKILEGAIYDKPLPASDYKASVADEPTWDSLKAEIQANIEQKWLPEWLKVGEVLSNRLGASFFKSWFLDAVLIELTSESAVLLVETAFKKYYIETHYQDDVERAFSTCFPTIKTVNFTVANP